MLTKYYNELVKKYHSYGMYFISYESSKKDLLNRLFLYYHAYNADETKFDEIESAQVDSKFIQSIILSDQEEDTIEIISVIDKEIEVDISINDIQLYLNTIDFTIAEQISGKKTSDTKYIRERFVDLQVKDKFIFKVFLLFTTTPNSSTKIELRELVSNFRGYNKNLSFILYFSDDIEEVISDFESPTPYIKLGSLQLIDPSQILIYGDEKSAITSVSAQSLKNLYLKYGSSGLFSSNLRFYVKVTKIDNSIKETIKNDPEKFWYYNNGIIITCKDYRIIGNNIEFLNFSIVNGGQTTTLIGNTVFDNDFGITCKIIKNKYQDEDSNMEFLAKVAEASNTQKPIKIKDLIANRIEQRKLKDQFKGVNVFLQIKRGEKINKLQYPYKWQNANNEEVGQTLFSFIYQRPGNAKNAKSAMLQNENNYRLIFQSQYNSYFLLGLQHIKVVFSDWKVHVKKYSNDNVKVGIATNAYFLILGVIGFFAKVYLNEELRYYIKSLKTTDLNNDDVFRKNLSQNDIGNTRVFKNIESLSDREFMFELFDSIYDRILNPAFKLYKNKYPNYGPGHFSKSDMNYYNNVLKLCIKVVQQHWESEMKKEFDKYFESSNGLVKLLSIDDTFEDYKPGLAEELREYRKKIFKVNNGTLNYGEIFSNFQISKIELHKPRTIDDLRSDIGMKSEQIMMYGKDILKIVEKYSII